MNREKTKIFLYSSLFFLMLLAGFVSAATVTIRYPSTGQLLNAVTGYKGDNINITVNATVLLAAWEINVTNVTFWYRTAPNAPWNLIGANASSNLTENAGNLSYFMQWNISTLADGSTYELNATAYNLTQVIGASVVTGLVLDHTPPAVTLDVLDSVTKKTKTQFFFGDELSLKCTRSDATAGFNHTNMSVLTPDATSFQVVSEEATEGIASDEIEVKFKNTKKLGTYLVICGVLDKLRSLNGTTNATFDVVIKPPVSSTRPKGFENPVGKKVISGEADLGRLTSEKAISVQLKSTSQVKMDVKGTTYVFSIQSFTESDLTLQTGSTTVIAKKGEPTEADLDKDGTNDLKVTYHKQFKKGAGATADVTFEAVATPVKAPPKAEPPKTDTTTEQTPTQPNKTGTLLVTIIVVVVIIVVGYILVKGKKK